jgi:hypothetical protein
MIVPYTIGFSYGWSASRWLRGDGTSAGSHPVFAQGFGARITLTDVEPVMRWQGHSFDPPVPVVIESPQESYLSTDAQDVSLFRPYTATWWKNTAGAVSEYATATSADFTGRHTGPSGSRLDHITISRESVPAPGGPSCDLDPHALWLGESQLPRVNEVDPNFSWSFLDEGFRLELDPRTDGVPAVIAIFASWVTPTDEVMLLPGTGYYGPGSALLYISFDHVQWACRQAGVSPDNGFIRFVDAGHSSENASLGYPVMGYVNPDWQPGVVAEWEAEHPEDDSGWVHVPDPIAVDDQTILYDFQEDAVIS